MSIYYLTLDNQDYEYPRTLAEAKDLGKRIAHHGEVKIESYTGSKRGEGGHLRYTLMFCSKQNKFIKFIPEN